MAYLARSKVTIQFADGTKVEAIASGSGETRASAKLVALKNAERELATKLVQGRCSAKEKGARRSTRTTGNKP